MKDTFKFQKDFESEKIIPESIARISLSSGNVCRLFFTPEGTKMMIPKSSLDNGDIIQWDNEGEVFGFIETPSKEKP